MLRRYLAVSALLAFSLPYLFADAERTPTPRVKVQFTEGQRFGITTAPADGKGKQLTRDERGLTNNTCIFIDGYQYMFGNELPGLKFIKDEDGRLRKGLQVGENKWSSTMLSEHQRVEITQNVEIVRGEQSQELDTVLVTYEVANKDGKPHTVGVRIMLDTAIGSDSGPAFILPGGGGATKDLKILGDKEVPAYVQTADGAAGAPFASLGLKIDGLEPVERLVLCQWPQNSEIRWDWKYAAMGGNNMDSCAVVYWDKMNTQADQRRTMGISYGMGRIAKVPEKSGEAFTPKPVDPPSTDTPKPPSETKPAPSDPATGDTKPQEKKPGEKKPGDKKPGKPGEKKPGDKKPGDKKPGDKKPKTN